MKRSDFHKQGYYHFSGFSLPGMVYNGSAVRVEVYVVAVDGGDAFQVATNAPFYRVAKGGFQSIVPYGEWLPLEE